VLVPLEGCDELEGVFPYVVQLAKKLHITAVLLSVVDKRVVEVSDSEATSGFLRYVETEARAQLNRAAEMLKRDGAKVEVIVTSGRPATEITGIAEREGCDLIAMCSHSRNVLVRGILGSVADEVIHSSSLPVLTVVPERASRHWQEGANISRIVVPLDGSPEAENALPYVRALAKGLSLDVVLIRTVELRNVYGVYLDRNYSDALFGNVEKAVEGYAIDYLQGIADGMAAEGLSVEWELLRGHPARRIVGFTRGSPPDLVVLTPKVHSGITRWAMGGVTESVLRASEEPVLVVPPKKA
jgi:nucleotide-binding universal stress UspA family protein